MLMGIMEALTKTFSMLSLDKSAKTVEQTIITVNKRFWFLIT